MTKIELEAQIEGMAPSPYKLGKKYLTVDGSVVRLTGVSNFHNSYQTMYMNDELVGNELKTIHRYTARDFGRVTGSDHSNTHPRNLRYPPVEVV